MERSGSDRHSPSLWYVSYSPRSVCWRYTTWRGWRTIHEGYLVEMTASKWRKVEFGERSVRVDQPAERVLALNGSLIRSASWGVPSFIASSIPRAARSEPPMT